MEDYTGFEVCIGVVVLLLLPVPAYCLRKRTE